jgi:hypothetical protein
MRLGSHGFAGVLVAAVLALGGCGASDDGVSLGLANRTDTPVGLYVNDRWIGTYPADSDNEGIPVGGRGGPPWLVEARSPSDATLARFEITAEDVDAVADGGLGTGARTDLPCGTIELWIGDRGPAGPAPEPDGAAPEPGPCP